MTDQLAQLEIVCTRIEAVTVDEVPDELVAAHRHRDSLWRLRSGDLACGLSHQRAWAHLLASDQPAALVLEDDAVLSPAIRDFLDPGLMPRLGADLIKLETYRKQIKLGRTPVAVGDTQLFELCSSQMGGAAYLITREAAARSLASPLRNTMGVDRLLFGRGGEHLLRSHILQAWPSPVVQLDRFAPDGRISRSDIKASLTPQRAPSTLPRVKSLLSLNLDHAERLLLLTLRDPGTWFRPRRVVPFAGDPLASP
jgi:GR25 family glycosyltransferase involved in LPS biosynthesis